MGEFGNSRLGFFVCCLVCSQCMRDVPFVYTYELRVPTVVLHLVHALEKKEEEKVCVCVCACVHVKKKTIQRSIRASYLLAKTSGVLPVRVLRQVKLYIYIYIYRYLYFCTPAPLLYRFLYSFASPAALGHCGD